MDEEIINTICNNKRHSTSISDKKKGEDDELKSKSDRK